MKIFFSWSGEKSKAVAIALANTLRDLQCGFQPWISNHDISAGSQWRTEVLAAISVAEFGIICLTRHSMQSQWVQFESGAMSVSILAGKICPYLIDVSVAQLTGPLAHFEACEATQEGTLKLISSMYELTRNAKLSKPQIRIYLKAWLKLSAAIAEPKQESDIKTPFEGYNRLDTVGIEKLLEIHFLASARRLELIFSEAIVNAGNIISRMKFDLLKAAAVDALNDGRLLLAPFHLGTKGSMREFLDSIFPVALLNAQVEQAVDAIALCKSADEARYTVSHLIKIQQTALKERLHVKMTGETHLRQ